MSRLILVEGESDRVALVALAERLDVTPPEIAVLGGAHAIGPYLRRAPTDRHLVGLCDKNEEPVFRRHLETVYVCAPDLEGELIRALGAARVRELVDPSFATLQRQVAYRGQPLEAQLRTFLKGRSGNKARYARLFVEALELPSAPAPLRQALLELP